MKVSIFTRAGSILAFLLFCGIILTAQVTVAQEELKVVYTSPVNKSVWNKSATNLILKLNRPFSEDEFQRMKLNATGGSGRAIEGKCFRPPRKNIIIFKPADGFHPGERVWISLNLFRKEPLETAVLASFFFDVEETPVQVPRDWLSPEEFTFSEATPTPVSVENQRNQLELPESFPEIEISVNKNPTQGFYFLNAFYRGGSGDPAYLMILDSTAFPVFYRMFEQQVSNFIYQEETGTLTYWDNDLLYFIELDSAFKTINQYLAKNAYYTDGHELIVKSDGSYWIIALDFQIIDMSQIVPGGDTAAIVEGIVLQEIDFLGNVIFQWRSWDHLELTDADPRIVDLTAHRIDYVHTNAIHFDYDSNLIISSRNLSEITKIDYTTGNILWRWGGVNNQFTITGDEPEFIAQHDIRYIGDSLYTLFDNGLEDYRKYSRGLVFSLNQGNKTGTLMHDFRDADSVVFSRFMGSLRFQGNNNYMVGWSGNSGRYVLTEFVSDTAKVFEMKSVDTATLVSYRALKYGWETSMFDIIESELDFGGGVTVGDSVLLDLTLVNNDNGQIEINGYHTIDSVFFVETPLPVVVSSGEEATFTVKFKPIAEKEYTDVLSLIYDTEDSRVASQIRLRGGGLVTAIFDDNVKMNTLTISPNPASKATKLKMKDGLIFEISLYDQGGSLVFHKQIPGLAHYNLNLAGISAGVYSIRVKTMDTVRAAKLFVY